MARRRSKVSTDGRTRGIAVDETALGALGDVPFLRQLVESAPTGALAIDESGTVVFANGAIANLLGYEPDAVVGEPFGGLVADDYRSGVTPVTETVKDDDAPVELQARHADGHAVPVELDLRELTLEGQRFVAGYLRELHGEDERADAVARYEAIAEMAGDGVYQLDRDDCFRMVSDTLVEMSGYDRTELLGEHVSTLLGEDAVNERDGAIREDLRAATEGVTTVEFEMRTAEGSTIPCEERTALLGPDPTSAGSVSVVRDVSERVERVEELQQERELIEHILETSPVGIGVINPDGDISRVNDRAEDILGLTMEEITSQTLDVSQRKFYDSEGHRVPPEDLLGRVFEDGQQVLNSEFTLERPDGDRVWAALSIAPMTGEAGDVEKAVVIATDITDRKEREETLREERDVIEHILETSPVGVGVITPDGDISRVNDRAEELFGLTDYEISNQTLDVSQRKLYDSDGHQVEPEDLLSRVFEDGEQVLDTDFEFAQPDGDHVWQSISIAPIESRGGDVEKAVIIATDITDRKEREETLREERELIEHILDTSPVGIGVINPDGDISRVNDRAEDLLGLTMEEITNQTLDISQRKFYDSEGHQVEPEDLLGRVFEDGQQVLNSEFTLERPDGDRVWAALSIAPMTGDGDDVEKAVIIATDITDRKEREETLREERDVIEHILETSPVGIGVINPDGDISRVNDRAEDILGLTMEEITNQTLNVSQRSFYGAGGERVPPEDLLSRVFEDGEQVLNSEFTLERPGGDRVWAALSIAPVESHRDVEKAVVIATDISDRKERERRLRESEARLRQIAENINSAIWMADADMSEVLYINPAYEDITGRSRDSVYDNLMNHLDEVHPQDRRRVEKAMKQVTQQSGYEDGSFRFQEKYRLVRPDGSTRWVNSFAFPLRDDDGEVYRFVGVIDDITEVKEQQLELGRHRDELERLNQINTVIRRVNQGLVQEKTREEIESQVCETLTNSKLYHAAWIGEAEGGRHIEPKAGAGIDVDVGEESLTVEEVASVATAVETGDVQIIQDVSELPEGLAVDAPTESGAPGGSQSFAAVIPLVYEETVYDVLVAYSARANAFGTREQAVLFELGKTIGLAINAVERKRALLTDEVLELELDVHDRDLFFVRASSDTGATFEMEGITSQSDGSYLQYFTVRGTEPERVLELAEEASAIEHARLVTDHEDSDACLVEFVVANSSLAPTLAEYGATVRTATFEDGEGTVVADLPRRADVRTTVEAVQSTFPDSTLVSKSRRERSVPTDRDFQVTLDETLTERQRTTLEAAYYAGFFDWPRDSSGEEVSETLDIAPATFHQHLRTGERKLVKTLVGEEEIA